jgi:hypothetical protein
VHRIAAEAGLQLAGCSFDDDLALRDDCETVGKLVGLFEVVRREMDRQRFGLGE